MKELNKKGQALDTSLLQFIVLGVVAVVGFLIIAELQDTAATLGGVNTSSGAESGGTWTAAYNSTITVNKAMGTMVSFLPIVAIVIIGGFVIMYLLKGFGNAGGGL